MDVLVEDLVLERGGRRVLEVERVAFPDGSKTAIFGPNGSGKTSLLRCIAGLESPGRGQVLIGNSRVRRGDARVAIAFQEPVFVKGTVGDNLALGLVLRGKPAQARRERVHRLAEECGVASLLDRSASELSAGEAQRTSLARALALAAPVTLLDEPLSGFDRIGRTRMLEEIPALLSRHAATALVVTHDREEAFRLADRIVILVGGRVTAIGATGEIYRAPPDPETAALLGYSVIRQGDGSIAVPPGALRIGRGEPGFEFRVNREIDMGNHRHVTGTIGETSTGIRLAAEERPPSPGSTIRVFPARWVAFPGS